jgi:hypothetical protein
MNEFPLNEKKWKVLVEEKSQKTSKLKYFVERIETEINQL